MELSALSDILQALENKYSFLIWVNLIWTCMLMLTLPVVMTKITQNNQHRCTLTLDSSSIMLVFHSCGKANFKQRLHSLLQRQRTSLSHMLCTVTCLHRHFSRRFITMVLISNSRYQKSTAQSLRTMLGVSSWPLHQKYPHVQKTLQLKCTTFVPILRQMPIPMELSPLLTYLWKINWLTFSSKICFRPCFNQAYSSWDGSYSDLVLWGSVGLSIKFSFFY